MDRSKHHDLDNSGQQDLKVPGFGGVPVDYEIETGEHFANGFWNYQQTPLVTARELCMVQLMEQLTDEPDWDFFVMKDLLVASGYKEELLDDFPLMSDAAWDWCVAEMRDKIEFFKQHDFTRELEVGSCVCRSDTTLTDDAKIEFADEIEQLFVHRMEVTRLARVDGGFEVKLVDPGMFPLKNGTTRVLQQGGIVSPDHLFDLYEKTSPAPDHSDDLPNPYTCTDYQRLPCEVKFDHNGRLKITSYVTDLHPAEKGVLATIKALLTHALPMWDACIVKGKVAPPRPLENVDQAQQGRAPLRIVTYGASWENELPKWAICFAEPYRQRLARFRRLQQDPKYDQNASRLDMMLEPGREPFERWLEYAPELPEPTPLEWELAREYLERPEPGSTARVVLPDDWKQRVWPLLEQKTALYRCFKHPEPGAAFSYEDWKNGRKIDRAVVDMISRPDGPHPPASRPTHESYNIDLAENFREQGLQVIVHIGGIDVLEGYEEGDFAIEGSLNEHIVATALYVVNVENATPCRMAFRQEAQFHPALYRWEARKGVKSKDDDPRLHTYDCRDEQTEVAALREIYGTELRRISETTDAGVYFPVGDFQEIGSVELLPGRLIAFPNTLEHRFGSFDRIDEAEPGRMSYIKLHLVDPHYRICSTQNVPPQQLSWMRKAVSQVFAQKGLPNEIADWIADYYESDSLISEEQGRQLAARREIFMYEANWQRQHPDQSL